MQTQTKRTHLCESPSRAAFSRATPVSSSARRTQRSRAVINNGLDIFVCVFARLDCWSNAEANALVRRSYRASRSTYAKVVEEAR